MIDRFGAPLYVGWAEHELLWVQAALTLDRYERGPAYQQIAEMTGRTFSAVAYKASEIRREQRAEAVAVLEAMRSRRVLVPERSFPKVPHLNSSSIAPPDRARLMAGR